MNRTRMLTEVAPGLWQMVQFIREDTLETAAWEMDYHHNPYELACWMHLKDTHFVWPQPVVDSSSPVPF